MLQNVRDNMKGTIAIIVVIIFVVPMVLTGFSGSSFLGNVAGNDAAKVNKRSITNMELERAIYDRKERMRQQGVDPASDQLLDENLRGPVLETLTQQAALVTTGKKSGMGISDEKIFSVIQSAPQFQVDGKFDRETYRRSLTYQNHTPATFKEYVGDILLVQQELGGLNNSTFVTENELNTMIAIAHERRSFSVITIPAAGRDESIDVTDEEIVAYYDANQSEFAEAEKMSVDYLELSVDELAQGVTVSEDAVSQAYHEEKQSFESEGLQAELQIAHLMLEKDNENALAAVTERLANGEDFAALVKEFSVDEGSRDNGGDLGVLVSGTFSDEFESAAYALEEGEVSSPVETDSGVHLIKAVSKKVETFPSLDEKRASIEAQLKRAQAEEVYASLEQDFEDMTFSATDLQLASDSLKLPIKTSSLFERTSGVGIAQNKAVRDAAWVDEILLDGRNSPKIQLGPGHAVVLRKKEHLPEHVLALDIVRETILNKLKADKLATEMAGEADAVIAQLQAGVDGEALSEEKSYTFSTHEKVKRFEAPVDFQARNAVFELASSTDVVYDSLKKANGDYVILSLSEVVKGQPSDMPEEQVAVMQSQIQRENAMAEIAAYQAKIIADSNIKIY